MTSKEQTVPDANKHDNRLHAQILQVKEAGTVNAKGEGKLRFLNQIQQNVLINNLQDLETRNKGKFRIQIQKIQDPKTRH